MIKYGILDGFGHVVRWVYEKPSDIYQFVTVKIKKTRKARIDLSKFEEALL
jgi:hypothetical protein